MVTKEEWAAQRAALERGEWVTGEPAQSRAQVPVKIPGGPVIQRNKLVYRARLWRRVDGKQEQDFCPHNHIKASAARECGQREVRRRNKEARDA